MPFPTPSWNRKTTYCMRKKNCVIRHTIFLITTMYSYYLDREQINTWGEKTKLIETYNHRMQIDSIHVQPFDLFQVGHFSCRRYDAHAGHRRVSCLNIWLKFFSLSGYEAKIWHISRIMWLWLIITKFSWKIIKIYVFIKKWELMNDDKKKFCCNVNNDEIPLPYFRKFFFEFGNCKKCK